MPPNESHDEFLELCAIATTGSLSTEERRRLEGHLQICAACREALAQYEAVIAAAIPKMAPESSLIKDGRDFPHWSTEQVNLAEAALFARLKEDEGKAKPVPPAPRATGSSRDSSGEALWRHVWWQYAAGLLLSVAFGVSLYKVGIRNGAESAKLIPSANPAAQLPVQANSNRPVTSEIPPDPEREHEDVQIAALRTELADRSAEIARLKAQQAQMAKDLADREADRVQFAVERAETARQLQVAETNLQTVQQKLDDATGAHSQDATRTEALEAKVSQLTESLRGREQELAREQELLDHDRDIRELMGSRDLYIAEVYDVAKTGTQKPFGRVFYTKEKSLTFYAYDLDQQPGIKSASTFQVWGRRGPDREHAVNLGILFEDNVSKKRWVLKSSNAKTLAEIDAVFVTVEPNGGSTHPSGKPLLFAYLKVEPNHP